MTDTEQPLDEDEVLFETEPLSSSSSSSFSTELKTKWIQTVLKVVEDEGELITDGIYGPLTRQAVIRFQTHYGFNPDGIVGQLTMTALMQTTLNYMAQQSIVPVNGILDQSTMDEIKIFQSNNGIVPDSIIGPQTMIAMIDVLDSLQYPPGEQPSISSLVLEEWSAHPKIHHHFERGIQTYAELRPLYQEKGIENPAEYLNNNIAALEFFGHRTPGHIDLRYALRYAEDFLRRQSIQPSIESFWAFVPRRIKGKNTLSNHAMGRAIDINPATNPHISHRDDILVIQSVTDIDLGQRQNADTMRMASTVFRNTFNQGWINSQSAQMQQIIARRRQQLDRYARSGFFDLEQSLIDALIDSGFSWGGDWIRSKDFMHFER